jgi:MFS family permease
MTFSGFVVGPIAGGFITQSIGVEYVFIIMSALCGVAALFSIPFLKETYAPVIRLHLEKSSPDSEKVAQALLHKGESIWRKLWLNLSRPVELLTHSFICFILSLYLAM